MGKETGISWTNHTFNPWWGCTKVSPGCDNCYAEEFDKRLYPARIVIVEVGQLERMHPGSTLIPVNSFITAEHWGKGAARRMFGPAHWVEPVKWNRDAERKGQKAFVFCASMADVMDDEAPLGERGKLWRLIDETPWLTWQLLTKRPQRFEEYLPREFKHNNVILMTTAENQRFYDIRWPYLQNAADKRGLTCGISYEPALGPLSVANFLAIPDWIIFGGETGVMRRQCETKWAEDLLKECREFKIKFFMKQMSAATPTLAKGLIPAHLNVQEMP